MDVLAAFDALPSWEQPIITLFAVVRRPLNRTRMAELLRMADLRDEHRRGVGTTQLVPCVARWIGAGILEERPEGFQLASPLLHPLLARAASSGELARLAALLRAHTPLRGAYGQADSSVLERELLLALYLDRDEHAPSQLFKLAETYRGRDAGGRFLLGALGRHAPAELLRQLGMPLAERYLKELLVGALFAPAQVADAPLAFVSEARDLLDPEPLALAMAWLGLAGHAERALELGRRDDAQVRAARCFVALTRGRFAEARSEAAVALESTRAKSSKKLKGLKGWLGTWVALVLLTDVEPRSVALARAQLEVWKRPAPSCDVLFAALYIAAHAVQGEGRAAPHASDYVHAIQRWDELLFWRVLCQVTGESVPRGMLERAKLLQVQAEAAGLGWVAAELSTFRADEGLGNLYRNEEPWQRSLRALEAAIAAVQPTSDSAASAPSASAERLVWTLIPQSDGGHHVMARVQTAQGAGWSAGRQLSWKKLVEADTDTGWLSAEDRAVLKHIEPPNVRLYRYSHTPDGELPLALVGHPRVFADAECRRPVQVVRAEVRIDVQLRDGQVVIALHPRACHEREVVCEHDGSGRVRVYRMSAAQLAIAAQLGKRGLELPSSARAAAERVVGRLVAHFPVSSALGVDGAELPEHPADPRIHVGLSRTTSGLRVRLFVAPIGPAQTFVPGEGSELLLGVVEHAGGARSVRARRLLDEERRRLLRLREACPSLDPDEHGELRLDDLEACLELLAQLRAQEDAVLVWAEGPRLEVAGERSLRDVRVSLLSVEGWLHAEGELEVDELTKLTLRALLDARQKRGRFVLLDDGRYLALSTELARTLELVSSLAELEEERLALHPLALLHLEPLESDQISADRFASELLARLREAAQLEPRVPAHFEASLRPYQQEGYAWLSRLSHWGGGACLADDMGLGKTLQALALLVERSARGPQLVIAPTSVCANWLSEARRFAPTLSIAMLSDDRERQLNALGPCDVLVCSYGLLQQEIERLERVEFEVVVLDEAQAIKNGATQRSKAAQRLKARVRVALTGTPVENQLGDLYSLMRFLNPGLLGTSKQFEARFARPIAREGDRATAQRLKRLIKPFVLRRKKSEVLDDLPHKTVITLRIEPSADERALYAALRERALEKLAAPAKSAQARIQVLAELMRLRRAACHPSLVLPDTPIESSKLAAFLELADELRAGGHRALVFSQFVDQLAIVRARLNELGIAHQYLDGSTSPAARARAVAAFRAGEGELFLISLKAGGFGLNLTAADYVVHLDPWWNPAVEDQASDRVHRIGQTRPVTVYRLVMKGSIEEKILALHESKRELADALLEGTESSATLSVDDLLALVRESADETSAPLEAKRTKRSDESRATIG